MPLGASAEYLGWFALSRTPGEAEWSEGEADVALDIGRDLGSALVAGFAAIGAGRDEPSRLWTAASVFGIAVGPALGEIDALGVKRRLFLQQVDDQPGRRLERVPALDEERSVRAVGDDDAGGRPLQREQRRRANIVEPAPAGFGVNDPVQATTSLRYAGAV